LPELTWPTSNARVAPHVRRRFYRIFSQHRPWRTIEGDWKNLLFVHALPLRRGDYWLGAVRAVAVHLGLLAPLQTTFARGEALPKEPGVSSDLLHKSAALLAITTRMYNATSAQDDPAFQARAFAALRAFAAWAKRRCIRLVI
jgi:hypothetical protein